MKNIKGQSLFEVILAIFIIALIIVGVVSLSINSIANASFSRNKTLASRYTQEAIEWIRNERETNYQILKENSLTGNIYCLGNPLDWTNQGSCAEDEKINSTIFSREVEFTSEDVNSKKVITADVITSWQDAKGTHEVRAVTYFTDLKDQ